MAKELSLEEGVEKAIRLIEAVSERPILVAVYGRPQSGKSFLIDKLGDHFEGKGLSVARYGGAPYSWMFEEIRYLPEGVRGVQLFHCAWDRRPGFEPDADPNSLADRILNRKLNLNIGIYNPLNNVGLKGDYDLVIANPDAHQK